LVHGNVSDVNYFVFLRTKMSIWTERGVSSNYITACDWADWYSGGSCSVYMRQRSGTSLVWGHLPPPPP